MALMTAPSDTKFEFTEEAPDSALDRPLDACPFGLAKKKQSLTQLRVCTPVARAYFAVPIS